MKPVSFAGLLSSLILLVPAFVAEAQVERLPQRGGGGAGFGLDDARVIRSGALLFAAFDTNQDFLITEAEIRAGATNTFLTADADGNGEMTPIEQRNWAARITSGDDVLGNSRLCAKMLEGHIIASDFADCMMIFAERFSDRDDTGAIRVSSFTSALKHGPGNGDQAGEDLARMRRPNIGPSGNGGAR